jgi:hypothetical protein
VLLFYRDNSSQYLDPYIAALREIVRVKDPLPNVTGMFLVELQWNKNIGAGSNKIDM